MYYWQTTHDYIHADLDPRKGYKFVINKLPTHTRNNLIECYSIVSRYNFCSETVTTKSLDCLSTPHAFWEWTNKILQPIIKEQAAYVKDSAVLKWWFG